MKKLLKTIILGGLMCLLAAALCGCGLFKPMDSLYALPALPEEYSQLQDSIQSVMDELQAEYAAITYGSYTSTIQLLDMDSNGSQETAAVFLRVTSGEEKPMRVCLFRRDADNTYRLTHTVQGEGTSIHSVTYQDLTGDGVRELIVSWQMSASVNTLAAYQLGTGGAVDLMSTGYNEGYLTSDLDGDGHTEIVVFHRSGSDAENNRAELYHYQDGTMIMSSVAPLSASVKDVTKAQTGRLSDGVPAIYVTCEVEGGVLTDILVLSESGLRNVTLDASVGFSQTTLRSYTEVSAADINGDGVMDIPWPVVMTGVSSETPLTQYIIYWRQFDSTGASTILPSATYHSVTDGWYLTLPGSWLGKITISRDDSRSIRGERAVVFYYWPDTQFSEPTAFLTVYRLTGDNRYSRAGLPGRTTLYTDSSAIYCASLNTEVWDCGIEAADLMERFDLITPEWSMQ